MPSCQIVSLDWLLGGAKSKRPLSASKYSFDKESTPKSEKTAEEKPTKKRTASEDETQDPKKKVKSSQEAKTKTLNIPVDEGFDQRDGSYKSKFTKASAPTSGHFVKVDPANIIF